MGGVRAGEPATSPYEPSRSDAVLRSRSGWKGALIVEVDPGSPAEAEGLEPGMVVTHVNGVELRDMIDWQWEADGPYARLEGIAYQGTDDEFEFECELERTFGQDWGVTFDGAVFDGMRLCRNDCMFCFMKMLPRGMRKTLYMRDDDYRLSFLQGNFVTLTNLTDADIERIVDCALSPLNVSLHAVTPEVRARLMGKNAARGIEALERLLDGGIEVHAQIVLVRGVNDGQELERTLDFVEERPLITSLGIVPLGFTKHQDLFTESFNDPGAALAVIDLVRPYQQRSREATGRTRYQLADEFYLSAGIETPPAEHYDGYPQYYDGIGMVRSFLDDADDVLADARAIEALDSWAAEARGGGREIAIVSGRAAAGVVGRFVDASPLGRCGRVFAVTNRYFGGNVDVTGLLTAADVVEQLKDAGHDRDAGVLAVLPDLMFNSDGLTLDGVSKDGLVQKLADEGVAATIATTTPWGLVDAARGQRYPR